MAEEARRLRRGLSDVSSLFEKKRTETSASNVVGSTPVRFQLDASKWISFWDGTHPDLAARLCRWTAFHTAHLGISTSRVSLIPQWAVDSAAEQPSRVQPNYQSLYVSFEDLELLQKNFPQPLHEEGGLLSPEAVYVEAPWRENLPAVLSGCLDHLVLIVHAEPESLEGAYRLIKELKASDRPESIELVFFGSRQSGAGEYFFEKFSQLVSRRLGVDLGWLGHLELISQERIPCVQFLPVHLLSPSEENVFRTFRKRFLKQWVLQHSNPSLAMARKGA